jgi:1-acyl-sn-glycerol-3-phosphate acyltransferase
MSALEAVQWARRARKLVSEQDRKVLLNPVRLIERFIRFAALRTVGAAGAVRADDVYARDPDLVEVMVDVIRVLAERYFRLEVQGLENVPPQGPALLVGNHNGGLVPLEGFFTALAIHDRFGSERAMYALVHDFVFEDPVLRRTASRLGMLRAGHGSAKRAFGAGGLLLVYPGSDYDAFRAFKDRGKVVLGGRKGFLKLALRAQVPIVPVVSCGNHEQFIVLTRGDRLAKLLRAHTWARTEVLPIVLAIPWGLTVGFVPYLPMPAQTSVSFLPPMRWPDLGPEDAEDPAVLERCYREVEGAMQKEMDRLSEGRRFLLGKRRARRDGPHAV